MGNSTRVKSTIDAWEAGALGETEEYAKVLDKEFSALVDEAAGLQLISIRLDKSLIDDLKVIASLNGIGYQPLIRKMLHRFAYSEMKRLLREFADQQAEKHVSEEGNSGDDTPPQRACC